MAVNLSLRAGTRCSEDIPIWQSSFSKARRSLHFLLLTCQHGQLAVSQALDPRPQWVRRRLPKAALAKSSRPRFSIAPRNWIRLRVMGNSWSRVRSSSWRLASASILMCGKCWTCCATTLPAMVHGTTSAQRTSSFEWRQKSPTIQTLRRTSSRLLWRTTQTEKGRCQWRRSSP